MRLDEVYGTLASFSDSDLRAFVVADRRRRSAIERAADQVFFGWLVRRFAKDRLAEARLNASAAIREAGLAEPHPTRVAARRLLPPFVTMFSVFAATAAFWTALANVLSMDPADRAAAGGEALSIGLAAGALMAWLVARNPREAGPQEPADVFGDRLQAAIATVYATTAGFAILPIAFVALVMMLPEIADLATLGLFVAGLALIGSALRVALRARALIGVWRPFEDAALAAVAHGRISDLDERLLAQPLDSVLGRPGALLEAYAVR
jgi:hypothetical protein